MGEFNLSLLSDKILSERSLEGATLGELVMSGGRNSFTHY